MVRPAEALRLARPLFLAALATAPSACAWVRSESKRKISPDAVDTDRLKPMVQTTLAGPLRVDAVVYKPKFLPLRTFLKRLSTGRFKSASRMAPFRYTRSNVDDRALKALIKKGFIPVFVDVRNTGQQTVDTHGLRLRLKDTAVELAPIPNEELPADFQSLNPKALAANTYNAAVVLTSSLIVLSAAASLDILERKIDHNSDSRHLGDTIDLLTDSVSRPLAGGAAAPPGRDVTFGVDNKVLNPITSTTWLDYNGLLFHPAALAPGEHAKGLVFFKAKGVDWSALRLEAAEP